jgi:hypothetical protein
MSYEQAREQALFLTDKMAYELNLTDDQYEVAYEVNLDYLMGINDYDDLYGAYWTRRNLDLSYILLDWQYRMYLDASYFYRPLYWDGGYWHFGIYARYPHRDNYFFGRHAFYVNYRGGHSWAMNGGRSWYHGAAMVTIANGRSRMGMRDGFKPWRLWPAATRYSSQGSRSFGNGGVRYDNKTSRTAHVRLATATATAHSATATATAHSAQISATAHRHQQWQPLLRQRLDERRPAETATRSFGSSVRASNTHHGDTPESSSATLASMEQLVSHPHLHTQQQQTRVCTTAQQHAQPLVKQLWQLKLASYSPSPSSFGSRSLTAAPSRGFGGGNVGGHTFSGSSSNNGGGRFGGHR